MKHPVSPLEEDSSASSAADSSASSTTSANPFLGDRGPGFDPASTPSVLHADEQTVLLEIPVVDEEQIRSLLKNCGDGAHAFLGVGQLDWVMTDTDQDRIAPPLTRIVNKHEELAQIASHSDELSVAFGTGLYAWRSLLEREAILRVERAKNRNAASTATPAQAAAPAPAPAPVERTAAFNGMSMPEGFTPEALRRFGSQQAEETQDGQ